MKATFYVPDGPDFLQNGIFLAEYFNGVKNYGFMFGELRRQLAEHGIDLATQDIHPLEESALIISLDEVAFFQTYQRLPGQRLYLALNEPAAYYPEIWKKENHRPFDRVFTYDYTLADGEKYIGHYFAVDLDHYPPFQEVTAAEFDRRKLLVLVAGMLQLVPPKTKSGSLLYIRYRTLRWFGKHLPEQFAFFSRGLDPRFYRSFRGLGILQRVLPAAFTERIVARVAARRRRVLDAINRGPIPPLNKLSALRDYRFVVCYENSSLPGYVSEKIFDCLFAGSVPVYLGEPDIQRFVPTGCFVDRRAFATDAALAAFLTQMPYAVYIQYIGAMRQFVEGPAIQRSGSAANARKISDTLLADLKLST